MADNLYGPIGPAKPGARARMQRVDALAARARAARMPKRAGQGRLVDANLTLRQPDQAVKRKVSQASSRLAMLKASLTQKDLTAGGVDLHEDPKLISKIGACKAAVCRLTTQDGEYGTAFMVNFENRACLATTHTLLPDPEAALAATVELDVEENIALPGTVKEPFEVPLDPDLLWVTLPPESNSGIDFTLVACAVQPEQSGQMWVLVDRRRVDLIPLVLPPQACHNAREAFMVQHANGALKATTSHGVTPAVGAFATYREPAQAGVSGAPLFSVQWSLVGIHTQPRPHDRADRCMRIASVFDRIMRWFEPQRQRMVLCDLYARCNGRCWRRRAGWMSDEPIDGWEGVRTDDQGNVLEIVLEGNELAGRIPVAVTECTRLWKLSLADNALDGVIPDAIARCGALRVLKLKSNSICGPLPTQLAALHNLEVLWLGRNDLNCRIPEAFGRLRLLRALYLSHNALVGAIPASLGDLENLELLDLGYNALSGTVPDSLGYLFNLRELYLFNNELSGELPESFVNLKNLRCLGVSRNRLRNVSATRRLLEEEYGKKQNLQLEPQMSSVGAI